MQHRRTKPIRYYLASGILSLGGVAAVLSWQSAVYAAGTVPVCPIGSTQPYAYIIPRSDTTVAGSVPIEFDGTRSLACGEPIVSYEWDFGNGRTANGPTVSHVFEPGIYQVSLTSRMRLAM